MVSVYDTKQKEVKPKVIIYRAKKNPANNKGDY